jgi:hypothetical protein
MKSKESLIFVVLALISLMVACRILPTSISPTIKLPASPDRAEIVQWGNEIGGLTVVANDLIVRLTAFLKKGVGLSETEKVELVSLGGEYEAFCKRVKATKAPPAAQELQQDYKKIACEYMLQMLGNYGLAVEQPEKAQELMYKSTEAIQASKQLFISIFARLPNLTRSYGITCEEISEAMDLCRSVEPSSPATMVVQPLPPPSVSPTPWHTWTPTPTPIQALLGPKAFQTAWPGQVVGETPTPIR